MYIPIWIIVIGAIAFYIYRSKIKSVKNFLNPQSAEEIESVVDRFKEKIFELEHFDSPHFIDLQDSFDAMEINYLRLKQRLFHTPEKVRELVVDWSRYVEALYDLKTARVLLDVDYGDDPFAAMQERSKEPLIVREEVEKKFRSILDKDWQEIPPDYFKRQETMKEPDKKTLAKYDFGDDWKYYYSNSANLYKLQEKRSLKKEEDDLIDGLEQEEKQKKEEKWPPSKTFLTKGSKILMVETDNFLTDLFKKKFEAKGINFFAIKDPDKSFLDEVTDIKPDLISMSMLFPKTDGLKLLENLKGNTDTKNVPVFFLTNWNDKKSIEKARSLGAIDWTITATITPDEIVNKYLKK